MPTVAQYFGKRDGGTSMSAEARREQSEEDAVRCHRQMRSQRARVRERIAIR